MRDGQEIGWDKEQQEIRNIEISHLVPLVVSTSVTIRGPTRNETAKPMEIDAIDIAVAVVRWWGGNQTAESIVGAAFKTGAAIPM